MVKKLKDWLLKSKLKRKRLAAINKRLLDEAANKLEEFRQLVVDSKNYKDCEVIIEELRGIMLSCGRHCEALNEAELLWLATSIDSSAFLLSSLIIIKDNNDAQNKTLSSVESMLENFKKNAN